MNVTLVSIPTAVKIAIGELLGSFGLAIYPAYSVVGYGIR